MTKYLTTHPQQIRDGFGAKGIAPTDIRGQHLAEFYALFPRRARYEGEVTEIALTNQATPPTDAPLIGVILETRRHFNLVFAVKQIHRRLGIPIQLFHGPGNLQFILNSSLKPLIDAGHLVLSQIEADNFYYYDYNHLVTSRRFWDHLIGREKILFFQTDSVLCPLSPHKISDFMEFDYIGSGWNTERYNGMRIHGGNGGLSLRDWRKSVDCLARFNSDDRHWAEDVYFALHMDIGGARVATPADSARFSCQDSFQGRSFGTHKLDNMTPFDRLRLIIYCPTAWRILPRIMKLRSRLSNIIRY
ncbi:MAG: hypothetical protein JKY31_11790 [Rhodobacteraceae bacterium]|nr:hypothetical protein [Paracoccaceae bacterium]